MDRKSEILLNGFCKEFGFNPDDVVQMSHTGTRCYKGPEVEVLFLDGKRHWCCPGPRMLPDLSERKPPDDPEATTVLGYIEIPDRDGQSAIARLRRALRRTHRG